MKKEKNEDPYASLKTGGQYYDITPKPETIQKRLDAVEDAYEMAKAEINELRSENEKLKLLLKESFESFPTKRLADRIYSIDGIERPEPEPLPLNVDEEIPF